MADLTPRQKLLVEMAQAASIGNLDRFADELLASRAAIQDCMLYVPDTACNGRLVPNQRKLIAAADGYTLTDEQKAENLRQLQDCAAGVEECGNTPYDEGPFTLASGGVAPTDEPDELRRAVRQMAEALKGREWAEHVSTDPDAVELEREITDLIGKPRKLTADEIGALWRDLSARGHASNWNDFWNVVRFIEQAIDGVNAPDGSKT